MVRFERAIFLKTARLKIGGSDDMKGCPNCAREARVAGQAGCEHYDSNKSLDCRGGESNRHNRGGGERAHQGGRKVTHYSGGCVISLKEAGHLA